MAYWSFLLFGISGYMLPVLVAFVGFGCFFESLAYMKRRWPWGAILLISLMGLLHLADLPHMKDPASLFTKARIAIGAPSLGGLVGQTLYDFGFKLLGPIGAAIVYVGLDLISLLFLTNFQLGEWLRRVWTRKPAEGQATTREEQALERRAKDLEKKKKQLEEEVAKSGLGADLQPVPEPTVRDLSVPLPKGTKSRKSMPPEPVKEPAPADEGEVIPAREVAAATSADILGKKNPVEAKPPDVTAPEPAAAQMSAGQETITEQKPDPSPVPIPVKLKPAPKKPKPITVAATPMIGN
jgi:hypothetical protein